MPDIRFQFTISVSTSGAVTIDPKIPEGMSEAVEREAMVLDGLNNVISALSPEEPAKVSETVKDALKERGITPEA